MLSFTGLRTVAAFGHPISSYEVKRILVGPVIVRLPPTPLAICPAPSPQYPNPTTLATSPSACLCAVAHTPPAIASVPSPASPKLTPAPSPSACLCAVALPPAIASVPSPKSPKLTPAPSPSACLCAVSPPPPHLELPASACLGALSPVAIPPPTCISDLPLSPSLSACLCTSNSKIIPPLPELTEADFDIFPKLRHEELRKPVRRYGTGFAPVEHKTEFVKIDDDDSLAGWECSFVDDYLPEGNEEKRTEKEKEKDVDEEEEGWEMDLLGVYVVDE